MPRAKAYCSTWAGPASRRWARKFTVRHEVGFETGVAVGQRNQDLLVRLQSCDGPHQAQVYGTVELTAARFPGAEVLVPRAATACAQRFAGYTGEPAGPGTELAFVEIVPTLASWSAGDRRALCVALGLDGVRLEAGIAEGGVT